MTVAGTAPPERSAPPGPRWAGVVLIVSGGLVIITETNNLLVLVGIALALVGVYALRRPAEARASSPDARAAGGQDQRPTA
jgi:hypothetical protein